MMDNDTILSRLTGDFKMLALLVGVETALQIAKAFGGLLIAVPKLDFIYREARDAEIRTAYDKGTPVKKLASEHRLTVRHIYNILGENCRKRPE